LGDVLLAVEDRSGVRRGDDGVVPTPDDDDIVADDFVSLYTDAVRGNPSSRDEESGPYR
jgi:hypothetical protein